jgi:hypothetical protein
MALYGEDKSNKKLDKSSEDYYKPSKKREHLIQLSF